MLETSKERVKLLKAGISGEMIERLYIESNNFRIVKIPPIIELMELEISFDENNGVAHAAIAECA